jgi:hypothetical protein
MTYRLQELLRWQSSVEGDDLLPSSYSCPRCHCHALCRLRRKGPLGYALSLLGLRPVRCLTCGRKSYIRLAAKDLTPPTGSKRGPLDAPLARVAPVAIDARTGRAA